MVVTPVAEMLTVDASSEAKVRYEDTGTQATPDTASVNFVPSLNVAVSCTARVAPRTAAKVAGLVDCQNDVVHVNALTVADASVTVIGREALMPTPNENVTGDVRGARPAQLY
eukprot:TRINITY_DN10424_c0_g1_i1.p2 TRINITY_DN10424_c0_g1~~TRINITY_DN10424_c0_g1_i1.p2  ORF type:complete len:113 (+),score=27.90 TRINITY_DN10424_c0_g1_i1:229-567(+)